MSGFIFENMDFDTCYRLSSRDPEKFIACYYSNVKIFPNVFPCLEDMVRHLVLSDNRFSTLNWNFFEGKRYDISRLERILHLNNFDRNDIERFKSVFTNTLKTFEF